MVCAASGTCKPAAHSDETVVLQYGTRGTESLRELTTAADVTLPKDSRGSRSTLPTPLSAIVQRPATTAGTSKEEMSTSSSVQCTNWTDVERFR